MTRVSQRTVYELRHDLEAKMNRVPISYSDHLEGTVHPTHEDAKNDPNEH